MDKIFEILLFIIKILALLIPLKCIEGFIKDGIKTSYDRLAVLSLVVVFAVFLYFIPTF